MISFRDITDLEPIDSIPDNADIVVVVDGVAKRISKENAKFGGGAAVEKKVFYVGKDQTSNNSTLYKDAELTTLVTAQEVYDAWAEGSLMLAVTSDGQTSYGLWSMFIWASGDTWNGDITNVTYVMVKEPLYQEILKIGIAPSTGVG